MSLTDYIIIAAVVALTVAITIYLIKRRKRGAGCCGDCDGCCGNCNLCGGCKEKTINKK